MEKNEIEIENLKHASANYRWIRRYLAKFHPEIMKEIWGKGIEVKTTEQLNKESVTFLPKSSL